MSRLNNKPLRLVLQAINYTVFMAMVWYFATSPSIRIIADDEAMITIAFAHAGELREPCRRLTQEELNALPPNMRKPEECARERSPVTIEMALDGETMYSKSLKPPGLFEDGGVDIYYRLKIPAGKHQLALKMNDSVRVEGFNHRLEREIDIAPAQIMLISFKSDRGFVLSPENGDGGS